MPGIFYPRHVLRIAAVLEDFGGGTTTVAEAVEWNVIPRTARLDRNDIHTADTLSVTLDFREFPFDPRLVRAASVVYYAGNTDGGALSLDESTIRFMGVVDTPESSLSGDAQTVTMECRDYTAVLLGERARPAMAVALDRPMDQVIADLLATLPGEWARTIRPVIQGPDGMSIPWPIVPGHGRRNARLQVDPKDTLWSLIRSTVEALGFVCFVDLDRLVVSTSRTLGADGQLRADASRVHVVFGRELMDLRLKRTMTNKTKPVALRQYNPTTGETTTSEWPTSAERARPSGGRRGRPSVVVRRAGGATITHDDADQAEEFAVTGTRSSEELSAHAQSIYRQRARYELEGSFTTHDPVLPQVRGTRGNPAPDFDVWAIHTATTLYADIGEQAGIAFDSEAPRADRERALVAKGYPAEVASALVTSWAQLSRVSLPFIVRKASLSLDGESGFRAEVDFMAMLSPMTEGEVRATITTSAPGAQTITFDDATLVRGR